MIKINYNPILGCTGWIVKRLDTRGVMPNRKKRNKKQKNGKR
tara:strand:- start:53 stop:178 length:126 start_codon:yes stop_codon:yes gene_type:complete